MKPGQTLICGPSLPPDSSFYNDARAGNNTDAYDWTKNNRLTEKIKAKPSFTPGLGFEITAVTISNTQDSRGYGKLVQLLHAAGPECETESVSINGHRPVLCGIQSAEAQLVYRKSYEFHSHLNKVEADPSFAVTAKLQATASGGLVDYAKLQFDYERRQDAKERFQRPGLPLPPHRFPDRVENRRPDRNKLQRASVLRASVRHFLRVCAHHQRRRV